MAIILPLEKSGSTSIAEALGQGLGNVAGGYSQGMRQAMDALANYKLQNLLAQQQMNRQFEQAKKMQEYRTSLYEKAGLPAWLAALPDTAQHSVLQRTKLHSGLSDLFNQNPVDMAQEQLGQSQQNQLPRGPQDINPQEFLTNLIMQQALPQQMQQQAPMQQDEPQEQEPIKKAITKEKPGRAKKAKAKKKITPELIDKFLAKAGNDPKKAYELALKYGYEA